MSQQILLTTTGTQSSVTINDLGGRTFVHPFSSYDLLTEYHIEAIRDSDDLQNAVTAGYITLTDDTLSPITNLKSALENAKLRFDENRNNTVDNAAQLNGQTPTYYLDRSNHTGTQTASSISDFAQQVTIINSVGGTAGWATSSANSYLLNNQNGSYYLNRTNHTGTQLSNTISDFYTATLSGTSGYATNSGNAYNSNNLNSQSGSFYLSRTNHTGTQTSTTISDFNNATNFLINSGTAGYAFNATSAYTAVNANNLNNQNAAFYLNRANHTGTQLSSTISDFTAAVLAIDSQSGTSGWATNAANTYLLNNQNAAFYLSRTNHTGTQLSSTISDFTNATNFLINSGTAGYAFNATSAYTAINANNLNNQNATFYLSRANQTGTQLSSTISDLSAAVASLSAGTAGYSSNAANAFLLGSQNGAYYLNRANHTGTQLSSTISDFNNATNFLINSGTAGYAFNATSAFTAVNANNLNNQAGSYYLNRANHTGTQLSSTISDFTNATNFLINSGTAGYVFNANNAFNFNNQAPSFYLSRANHTGTQAANTISDLSAAVAGLSAGTSGYSLNTANAYLLNNQAGSYYLNRANHTGTQLSNTISDFNNATNFLINSGTAGYSANAANAFLLGSQNGTYYLNRANHTGTQLSSTISDFNNATNFLINSGTAGYAFNATSAFTAINANNLNNQAGSYYLNRTNHTGTQLSSTISDFNNATNFLINSGTAGYAFNASNAFLLGSQNGTYYLTRANHIGSIPNNLFLDNNLNVRGDAYIQGTLYSTAGISTPNNLNSATITTGNITSTGTIVAPTIRVSGQTFSIGNVNTTSDIYAQGKIYGTAGFSTPGNVNSATITTGNITSTGNVVVSGTTSVIGNVYTVGSLNSNGDANINGTLYSTTGISTQGNLFANGNISSNGNISTSVGNIITTSGSFTSTTGGISVGAVASSGSVSTGNITSTGTIRNSGQLFTVGNINGTSDLYVQGKIYGTSGISTPGNLNSATITTGNIINTGNSIINGNESVTGAVFAVNDLNTNADVNAQGKIYSTSGFSTPASVVTSTLTASNNIVTSGSIFINGSGSLAGTSGWASSTDNTYALQTSTGSTVDVWQSAAPIAGQFLVATSPTTAIWSNIANAGTGGTGSLNVTAKSYSSGINAGLAVIPASGTYLVQWSATVTHSANSGITKGCLFAGGVQQVFTECQFTYPSNGSKATMRVVIGTSGIVTVNGSQAIEARFIVESGTATITYRNMTVVKIG